MWADSVLAILVQTGLQNTMPVVNIEQQMCHSAEVANDIYMCVCLHGTVNSWFVWVIVSIPACTQHTQINLSLTNDSKASSAQLTESHVGHTQCFTRVTCINVIRDPTFQNRSYWYFLSCVDIYITAESSTQLFLKWCKKPKTNWFTGLVI